MNKKIINLIIILMFLTGIAIFLYPTISNKLSEKKQYELITSYERIVSELPEDVKKKEMQMAIDYNNSLNGDPVKDPYLSGSGTALPDNYLEVLNINDDSIMSYISIPKVDIKLPIYHGVSDEVLEKGAGHIYQTSLPIGGESTHSVIIGHTGLATAKLFTDIRELAVGDLFYINALDNVLAYEVSTIQIIEPENIDILKIEPNKDMVTLVTCTPYAINSHRLLVTGERVSYEEDEKPLEPTKTVITPENQKITKYIVIGITIFIFIIIIILVIVYLLRKKGRGKND